MYCKKCGHKILDDAKFCVNCGVQLEEEKIQEVKIQEYEIIQPSKFVVKEQTQPKKVWDVFAKIGFGLGLGGLIAAPFTCGSSFLFTIAGIVFSALGNKSKNHLGKAIAGLVLSIIGTALCFVFLVAIEGTNIWDFLDAIINFMIDPI